MKISAQDFKRLQWSIVLLVALAAIGGGLVWSTTHLRDQAEKALKAANAKRADVQARLVRARDEEQELRTKIAHYQELEGLGYIGPERRLDWIEAIAAIRAARRVQDLDYEFAAQRPVDAVLLPGGASAGSHEVMSSAMRLRMSLLHEGDLLNFIADLKERVHALIIVRSCGIERVHSQAERSGAAQLDAECTLEWVTLRERK